MNDLIISRDQIRAKARVAHQAGNGRNSHCMNWHSAALATWLAEYDRLASLALELDRMHGDAGIKDVDRRAA